MVRLGPDRWREVAHVEARSFPVPWDERTVRKALRNPSCRAVGAEDPETGTLVGHAVFAVHGTLCHLLDLAVLPERRRRGVGTELVHAVCFDARSARASDLFLEVREGNQGAQAFYRTLGFTQIGRKRAYYPDTGEDAVVLATKLVDLES